jgi:hypothetical protein
MAKTIEDPRAEAMKYMAKHKVLTLFDILGARLAKEQPDDPNEFLLAELTKIAHAKANNAPVRHFLKFIRHQVYVYWF